MRRFTMTGLALACAGILWSGGSAEAGMILSLSDGTDTASCDNRTALGVTDCGTAGFLTTLDSNSVLFNGLLGDPWADYDTSVTAAFSNVPGSAALGKLDVSALVLTKVSGLPTTFTITATAFGYTLPTNPLANGMILRGSGSITAPEVVGAGGTVTVYSYADPDNDGAQLNGTNCAMAVSTNASCSEPSSYWTNSTPDYSITTVVQADLAEGQSVNINSSQIVTAVPEPGTLLLLGGGISALALRRRRKS